MQIQTIGAVRTMTSIELLDLVNQARAEFGETEVRRNDFTARCRDELDGEHYETFVVENANGTESVGIKMSRDQCMYVLMRESKAVRRAVAAKLNGYTPMHAIPATYAAALRLAAEQAEQIEQQAAALALAAPKVEIVDRYMDATGTQTFREVAKLLGAKEPAFRAFLAARRVMYQIGGNWVPYAEHIDAGRFVVKTGSAANGHAFSSTRFTPKGVAWVSALWGESMRGAA